MTRPRNPIVDSLFVAGMLLVVAGHAGVDYAFNQTAPFRWIYAFHMPLFFALAGYLFRYTGGGTRPFGAFVRSKALRLLLPLAVWTTLVFVPKGLLAAHAMRPSELTAGAFLHAFLYPADNPIRPLWFLEVLFEVYVAGYGLDRLVRHSDRAALLAAAACLGVWWGAPKVTLLMASDAVYYTFFFLLGDLFRRHERTLVRRLRLGSAGTTAALGALSCAAAVWPSKWLGPLYAVAGILFLTSAAAGWQRLRGGFLPALRPYTFTIYLLHWVPLALLRGFVWPLLADGASAGMRTAFGCAMFAAGVLVPCLAGRWAGRQLPRDARFARRVMGL